MFEKINKTKARRLYREGRKIYVVPCKVYTSFRNLWVTPFEMSMNGEDSFDNIINNYEKYNCCYELGYYASYYIISEVDA